MRQNGEVGTVKMTMPIAWTTGMVAWGMLDFKEGYTKAGEMQAGCALSSFHQSHGMHVGCFNNLVGVLQTLCCCAMQAPAAETLKPNSQV